MSNDCNHAKGICCGQPFDVDAWEIAEQFRIKARDEFLADMAITRDPDGYDEFNCIECGKEFTGKGRLCARCYWENKS